MARLAPCLAVGRAEVNVAHPARDRASDGWIGNVAHARSGNPEAGGSKHNPNRRNIVCAWDADSSPPVDMARLLACWMRHPSSHLTIYNRVIRLRRTGWRPQRYTGPNPHTMHGHLEARMDPAAENDDRPWGYRTANAVPAMQAVARTERGSTATGPAAGGMARLPVLRRSPQFRHATKLLQRALKQLGHPPGGGVDGRFGPGTRAAVIRFQRAHRLTPDGAVGPKTWVALAQALLTRRGFPAGAADGDFGPKTATATRRFQQARGLKVDGVWGPKTWTAAL